MGGDRARRRARRENKGGNDAAHTDANEMDVQPYGDNQWLAGQLTQEKVDNVRTPLIIDDPDRPMAGTQDIPQYHVIMEQLAHRFAYNNQNLNPEQMAKLDSGLAGIGYKRIRVIESSDTGFQAVLFEPVLESAPVKAGYKAELGLDGMSEPALEGLHTVVAFRGTCNLKGLLDDADPTGIGTYQFAMHEAEIRDLLAQANSLGHGRPDVTGHSLGGALAQLATASYGDMIQDIITFQSPGLNANEANSVDPEEHASTHYRMAGDIVPTAGDNVTSGQIVRFSQEESPQTATEVIKRANVPHISADNPLAHMACPLAQLNAHRHDHGDNFVPGVYDLAEKESHLQHVELQSGNHMDSQMVTPVSEVFRAGAGMLTSQDMWFASAAWRELRPRLDEWAAAGMPVEEAVARARTHLTETINPGLDFMERMGGPASMASRSDPETQAYIRKQLIEQAEFLYKQLLGDNPWTEWAAQRNGEYGATEWASLIDRMMNDNGGWRDLLDALHRIRSFGMLESMFSESEHTPMQVVKALAASSARLPREFVQLMAGTPFEDELSVWWTTVEERLDMRDTSRAFEEESGQNGNTPKLDGGLSTGLEERVANQIAMADQQKKRAEQKRLLAETKEMFARGTHVPMTPERTVEYTAELQQGLDHRDVPGVARTLEQISAQFGNAGLDQLLRDNFTVRSFDDVAAGGMNVVAAALLNTSFHR